MNPKAAKRIAILCNAIIDNPLYVKTRIETFPLLVAVDGGTAHCRNLGLRPDIIIGDLDSCSREVLDYYVDVPFETFPRDKDKTDLELALNLFMHSDTEEITVFGALGYRVDHTLTNLWILSRFPGRLFIESSQERLFFIDHTVSLDCAIGQTLSLIPLNGPATGIYTEGLQWNLSNAILDKNFIGISNRTVKSPVRISVQEGDLLCCMNTSP